MITDISVADIIQDLYLKELKAYKIPADSPSDAEGSVQVFKAPATPKSPEESGLEGQVTEYESQTVEVEGQAATGETQEAEEDYFEDLEDEAPTPGAH